VLCCVCRCGAVSVRRNPQLTTATTASASITEMQNNKRPCILYVTHHMHSLHALCAIDLRCVPQIIVAVCLFRGDNECTAVRAVRRGGPGGEWRPPAPRFRHASLALCGAILCVLMCVLCEAIDAPHVAQ